MGDNGILLTRVRRRVARAILSRLFVDAGKTLNKVVFLAGTGRGGTTWVSHLLNYRNEYRYIFEPFPSPKARICDAFKHRHYLRPENNDPGLRAAADTILSGRFRNGWIDRYNRRLVSRKRLIKDIRANLLLKWLHTHFPEVRIILLLRHPCAVASSRTKLGAKLGWVPYLDEFLTQPELIEDFLSPFRGAIEQAKTDFEKHIFAWCIENYVPLRQFQKGEIHLAFYESFCRRPAEEIARMFAFLGESLDDRVWRDVAMPMLARKDSAIFSGDSLVDGWRKHVSAQQLRRACEIVRLFSLDRIYSEESLPDVDRAHGALTAV
jgi:hypothetical protein